MTYTVKTLQENWDSLTESECTEAASHFKLKIEEAGRVGDQDSQKVLSSWVDKLQARIADLRAGKASVLPRQPKPGEKPTIQPSSTVEEVLGAVLDVLRQAREHPAVKADKNAADAVNECGLMLTAATGPGAEAKPEKAKKGKEGT